MQIIHSFIHLGLPTHQAAYRFIHPTPLTSPYSPPLTHPPPPSNPSHLPTHQRLPPPRTPASQRPLREAIRGRVGSQDHRGVNLIGHARRFRAKKTSRSVDVIARASSLGRRRSVADAQAVTDRLAGIMTGGVPTES